MNKKKAIKIATASAIAASGFVAAAPVQTSAAPNIKGEVARAKNVMYDAMYAYSKPWLATGELVDRTVAYNAYKKGEAQYKYAVNYVNKYEKNAKTKATYLADLANVRTKYLLGRSLNYIKSWNALELQVEPAAKKLDAVVASATTEEQIKDAQAELKKVYDAQQNDLAAVIESSIEAHVKSEAKKAYDTSYAKAEARAEVLSVPKVSSVSAINAKQVEVKFNKAVDASTVFSNVAAGTISTTSVSVSRTVAAVAPNVDKNVSTVTGKLSADGKTLTLTAAGTTYFDGSYAVTVSDLVKTTDNKALTAFAGTTTLTDTVAPTVTETVYNTVTNEVEITLSEPVNAVPDVIRLNGTPVAGATFVADSDNKKVKVSKPASIAAGSSASIYVAGAVDGKGNTLTPFNGNVTFTTDASAPQVSSVTQISSNKAKVTFSKSIASTDAVLDGAISVIQDGTPVAPADITAALDTTDTSKKSVIVTFNAGTAPNYFYGSASSKVLTFTFTDNVITDVFNKKLAATTSNVTMSKDVSGPKAVSTVLGTNGTSFEVKFDEEIAATGTAANIVLRKDGVAMATAATAARKGTTGEDAKTLVITANNADLTGAATTLPAGTYSVRLNTNAILDAHANSNVVETINVTKSGSSTDLRAAIVNNAATPNEFQVTYSEDVNSSALNLANYKLDGAALPAGSDIYYSTANQVVVITLPNGSVNIGSTATPANARLSVSNVQTSGGKTVVANASTVTVKDNTSSQLQNASLVSANVLKLTFNEDITATGIIDVATLLSEVEIKAADGTLFSATGIDPDGAGAATAVNATAAASVSGKDIVITVTPGTSNWSAVTSGSLTAKTLDSGITDSLTDLILDTNGVKAKALVSVNVTK